MTVRHKLSRARRAVRAARADSAPADREAQFAAAAEAMLDALFVLESARDRTGRITDFVFVSLNGAGERLLGLPRERVVGTKLSETIPVLRSDAVFDAHVGVAEGGAPFEGEFANTAPEIRAEWLHQRVVPAPGGIAIALRDIGERKQMQAALSRSEARYRSLYDDAPVMLHSIDRDGRLVAVSDVWLRTLGYAREEAIGRKSVEFLTEASRRHAVETILPEFMRTGICRDVPYRLVKKNGETVDVLLSATAERDADGRVVRSLAIMTDLTERKRAEAALQATEARLQALADNTPTRIFMKDCAGRYLFANREFERFHSISAAEIRGKTAHEIFPQADAEIYAAQDREVLRVLAPVQREITWQAADGLRSCAELKFPIFDESGAVAGIGCIETDTTERKRAEEVLRAAKEAAEEANRAKSDFLANMSHELRTPLNAILGFSETIANELFGPIGQPRYAAYARDIHASGSHLLAIINEILDLSKIEAGRYEICPEAVEAGPLVEACMRIVSGQATEGEVTLSAWVDPALPPLYVDERAFKQILLDLLSNALKFTPVGGAVAVAVERLPDGGAALRVSDTGIGIAAADIPRVLTPFVQVESAMTRSQTGTGLGLPIVKALVELHDGEFSIDSALGCGTTVTARFGPGRVLVAPAPAAARASRA